MPSVNWEYGFHLPFLAPSPSVIVLKNYSYNILIPSFINQ